jgi:hypothetical protein
LDRHPGFGELPADDAVGAFLAAFLAQDAAEP